MTDPSYRFNVPVSAEALRVSDWLPTTDGAMSRYVQHCVITQSAWGVTDRDYNKRAAVWENLGPKPVLFSWWVASMSDQGRGRKGQWARWRSSVTGCRR